VYIKKRLTETKFVTRVLEVDMENKTRLEAENTELKAEVSRLLNELTKAKMSQLMESSKLASENDRLKKMNRSLEMRVETLQIYLSKEHDFS
jgi:hypothetical protein